MQTTNGQCCVFPFEFKGKKYTECTKDHHTKLWCGTSPKTETWGECATGEHICCAALVLRPNENGTTIFRVFGGFSVAKMIYTPKNEETEWAVSRCLRKENMGKF